MTSPRKRRDNFGAQADTLSAELRAEALEWKSRAQSERMRRGGSSVLADILADRARRAEVEAGKVAKMAADARWHEHARGM